MITEHFSYLQTTPQGEDLFAGKSHEAISKIIARQIKCGNNCQMIGIDGGWGAGKSNLVRLISKELNGVVDDKKKHMFPFVTYDAWGHSSDLQRRTILEEITKALINEYDCLDESWKSKLDELLAKKKNTHSINVPRLNTAMIVAGFLVAITPLVNWIVSLIPGNCQWTKVLAATLPYILGLIYAIRHKNKTHKKSSAKDDIFSSFFEELFLIYDDKISEETTYEVISEDEPSSCQFKEWMHGLDNSLKDDIKIVLVFDNMDRLPIAKVQEFWAAIHSFFAEEIFKNIIIIVPFDRSHIINAFKSEDIGDGENKKHYGNDFINKTFTVIYRVAPPIMSDWKSFFYQKWQEAFGPKSKPDNEVTQIYDVNSSEITPRNIIAFINELITLKSISIDSIPDKYLALYIFGKDEISENCTKELLSPAYLGNLSFLYKNDTEMAKYMSAIHYQLPIDKAMDVVFTRQFKNSLDNKNENNVSQLAKNNSVFKSIAEVAILEVNNIENATTTLEAADLSNIDDDIIDYIWQLLYQRTCSLGGDFSVYKSFHTILLSHISKRDRYKFISMLIKQYQSVEEKSFNCKAYVQGVDAIRLVDTNELESVLKSEWEISAPLFMKLTQITKESYGDYGYYCSEENLDDYLSNLDISDWGNVSINKHLAEKYKFERYKNKLVEKIKLAGNNLEYVRICIERLKEIQSYIVNAGSLMDDSVIYSILNSINKNNSIYADLICIAMSKRGSYGYSNYNPYLATISSPSEEEIESASEVIEYYISYGELLVNNSGYNNALAKAVVGQLTEDRNRQSRLNITECLKNYVSIKSHYSFSPKCFLTKLNNWYSSYKGTDVYSTELISDCVQNENKLTELILNSLNQYLEHKSQEEWCSDLKSTHKLADYYSLYHPEINQNLFDAIKELINNCVVDNNSIANKDIIDKLLSICYELGCDVKNFFIDTLKKFETVQPTKEKIIELAPWVFKYIGNDLEDLSEYLFKFLATEVLSDNAIVSILYKNRQQLTFKKTDEFERKIKQLAEENSDDESEIIQLAKYWKLMKEKK